MGWNMIKALKCCMGRTFSGAGFPAAVFVTFLLCFTESIYIDSSTMQAFSVSEALFRFDRAFMEGNPAFYSLTALESALSGYSAMFLPVLASFPFVYAQSAERNSGNIRFSIFRTGRRSYYLSRFICAVFSGGACIMLGVLFFGIFAFCAFPYPDGYAVSDIFTGVARKLVSAFIYGCANTSFAFFLSSFCRNRYIVLCVPFLMRFMQDTAVRKVTAGAAGDSVYEKVFPFECYAPSRIPYLEAGGMLYSTVAVTALFMALMLSGYVAVMEHRTDKGE